MSMVEIISDAVNLLLSRREITCSFEGVGGRLGRLESVDLVVQECGLGGKAVIPMRLKNHVGMPTITGLFYVYDDENLAKRHVNPAILSRLEKSRKKAADGDGSTDAGQDGVSE